MNDISIVIVNYNTFVLTSNCVRSIIEHTHDSTYEIILVDNSSSIDDPDKFLVEFPQLTLIKSSVNGGFAYGNNLGIEKASGNYILLLNSDTVLKEDTISKTLKYLQQQDKAGVVGCRMVYPDRTVQYTARRFRSIGWELLDLFRFVPLLMSYRTRSEKMLGKYFRHDEDRACDWVSGAFFLFPKEILNNFPRKKLDERFFMYGEDQLWCEQIKAQGHQILFYAGSTLIHINSGSTSLQKQIKLRSIMMKHELEIMKARRGRSLYYYMFKLIYVTKETARNIIKSIAFRLTGRLMR